MVVTKRELHRYGIKAVNECPYCGERDSIDPKYYYLTWKIFIFQVVVVMQFHSITPSLPVRYSTVQK